MVNTRRNTQANRSAIFTKLKNKYGKWLGGSEINALFRHRGNNASINEGTITKKAYEKATLKYYSNAANASGDIVKSITELVRERLTAPECPCGPAPPVPKIGSVVRAGRSILRGGSKPYDRTQRNN